MDDLRLILLLSGVVVILLVYAWTRYQRRPRRTAPPRTPPIGGQQTAEPDAAEIEEELARMGRMMADPELETSPSASVARDSSDDFVPDAEPEVVDEPRLLVISVMAGEDRSFEGRLLRKAFDNNLLEFHQRGLFQRLVDCGERRRPVFGVANVVQPGVFASADLDGLETKGITLFLQLPAPVDALEAFDDFVTTAERLAVELGGELRDEQQQILTHQALMQIRTGLAGARPGAAH